MKVEERLLKYVSYWTTSDESCSDIPSSEREFTLAKALKQELETLRAEKLRREQVERLYETLMALSREQQS